ncbi:sugar transferase [Algoriphagus namhaensis]|uniref:Sugar transferase n=1 Tax=Algoriphagus namhaensis TaxID=915353 RepID=A0ABV8AVR7_9BACT
MIYQKVFKRPLDIFVASILFLILSPVFILLSIALFVHHSGHPFFYQWRPGLNGKCFKIIKFKTMSDEVDEDGILLSDDKRLGTFGKMIRKASLDEIPQLINVIRGDMSLVGPRPLLREYLGLYSPTQAKRHRVRPGVTGWAQVNGRNAITWEKKFDFDVWYVENLTFLLDFQILVKTFFNVITGKGVTQHGHVSVGKFQGQGSNTRKLEVRLKS